MSVSASSGLDARAIAIISPYIALLRGSKKVSGTTPADWQTSITRSSRPVVSSSIDPSTARSASTLFGGVFISFMRSIIANGRVAEALPMSTGV